MVDTHQCERVAEENESRRGLGKLVCQVFHFREDLAVLWTDLLAFAIDDICHTRVSWIVKLTSRQVGR